MTRITSLRRRPQRIQGVEINDAPKLGCDLRPGQVGPLAFFRDSVDIDAQGLRGLARGSRIARAVLCKRGRSKGEKQEDNSQDSGIGRIGIDNLNGGASLQRRRPRLASAVICRACCATVQGQKARLRRGPEQPAKRFRPRSRIN